MSLDRKHIVQTYEILSLGPLPSQEPGHVLVSEQMPSTIQMEGKNQIPSTSFVLGYHIHCRNGCFAPIAKLKTQLEVLP